MIAGTSAGTIRARFHRPNRYTANAATRLPISSQIFWSRSIITSALSFCRTPISVAPAMVCVVSRHTTTIANPTMSGRTRRRKATQPALSWRSIAANSRDAMNRLSIEPPTAWHRNTSGTPIHVRPSRTFGRWSSRIHSAKPRNDSATPSMY